MIGERIRELRKARGWSQGQLAGMVGNDGNTISRWELNKVGIGADYLSKLADILGTSTDYLLGKTDDPTPSALEQVLNNTVRYISDHAGELPPSNPAAPEITQEEAMSILRGDKSKAELPESNVRIADNDIVWVPVVSNNIKVCCGEGNDYGDIVWDVIGKYPILTSDLIGYSWQIKDGGVHIITVEGDSMEPKVNDGDRILIVDVEVRDGDLAVCLYRDRTILRGVSFEKDGVRLIPWNKDYSEIFVPKDDSEDLRFVGKMIGIVQLQIQPLSSMI